MPVVPFDSLPDSARVWIFGSDQRLSEEGAATLMREVGDHLANWKAHGEPLTVGSQLIDDRFLVVAVDQSTTGASGCSIDGLFRVLRAVQGGLGVNLVGGGRLFYRDGRGQVRCAQRSQLDELRDSGEITNDTVVFDTTITDLGTFRSKFERAAEKREKDEQASTEG
ncbi:MAG TPA: hypothetical protein VFP15_09635 [Gemmatimonadaceae bacterium]|nr:hypothetical protein [Gemmatimonadaceae bacterium]